MIQELISDEEFLQQPSEPATPEDAAIAQDLIDTMNAREDCACLAANQIGVAKAIIVYKDDNDNVRVMYNPVIKQGIVAYKAVENCLSLNRDTEVKRFKRITVTFNMIHDGTFTNHQRKLNDWTAEIVQHAIDHCNGILV